MSELKRVRVLPYDDRWPQAFSHARATLEGVLAASAPAIHHIGSTSVPGLCAKPVIDMLVEASDLKMIEEATPVLEGMGYAAKGEYGIPGRRYFSRPPFGAFKVHVHAFQSGAEQIDRHLLFRDFLRAHPLQAGSYCALKRRLAAEHSEDRAAYQAGKVDFVEELHRQARRWADSS